MSEKNFGWAIVCQLIVIVPGGQLKNTFPKWPVDLAITINSVSEQPEDQAAIQHSVVRYDQEGDDDPKRSKKFILFDWSERSRDPSVADESILAGKLSTILIKRCNDLKQETGQKVDLHLIGHSRGCYMLCAALRRWRDPRNLRYVLLTTLDPQSEGRDGKLESNPGGMVDWSENYYQTLDAPRGTLVDGALNIKLNSALVNWNLFKAGGRHSQVHEWYEGMWSAVRIKEHRGLFETNPIVEMFNGNSAPAFFCSHGRGSQNQRLPTAVPGDVPGVNKITKRRLQLLPADHWLASTVFCVSTTQAENISAEFTFQVNGNKSTLPADGIAYVISDATQKIKPPLGRVGGELGYAGLKGFAVAFDNYYNPEHKDPLEPGKKVSLRINGSSDWIELPGSNLPENLSEGNLWRARVALQTKSREISWQIYSFGQDQKIAGRFKLPGQTIIPKHKLIGFTAASGNGAQTHAIDDIRIVYEN